MFSALASPRAAVVDVRASTSSGEKHKTRVATKMRLARRDAVDGDDLSCWSLLKGCFDNHFRFHAASEQFLDAPRHVPFDERHGVHTSCDAFAYDEHLVLVYSCEEDGYCAIWDPYTGPRVVNEQDLGDECVLA